MKLLKIIYVILFMVVSNSSFAQSGNELLNAIKSTDMITVETFFQDKIEFCIEEDQQILAKAAAVRKFKLFLDDHKPISIEVIHNGNSKDKASQYKVAKLVTTQGIFRIFIYSTGDIKSKSVKEIRIDRF
ncbi:MAG: DUF4783 domain-containing protein [Saprospiraceae bacterium]|nr:DUF4783 domain-containing protein [Saprospiraceae bacterium]MBK8819188.1 DUF4783 domain-containing protein [Saprospiraceae bacterium]MBK9043364.1 DUF4783 domain-containing protein [Saprospiraceae bacterium]